MMMCNHSKVFSLPMGQRVCLLEEGHIGEHETYFNNTVFKWSDAIDHPPHYGGADNPYEAIKVIEAWDLGFCLGNAVKYLCRMGKKNPDKRSCAVEDLKKARWYIDHEIEKLTESL